MSKPTNVKLKTKDMKEPQEFGFDHAQKILNIENNGGWKLADSNFILDENGNITRKPKGSTRED